MHISVVDSVKEACWCWVSVCHGSIEGHIVEQAIEGAFTVNSCVTCQLPEEEQLTLRGTVIALSLAALCSIVADCATVSVDFITLFSSCWLQSYKTPPKKTKKSTCSKCFPLHFLACTCTSAWSLRILICFSSGKKKLILLCTLN